MQTKEYWPNMFCKHAGHFLCTSCFFVAPDLQSVCVCVSVCVCGRVVKVFVDGAQAHEFYWNNIRMKNSWIPLNHYKSMVSYGFSWFFTMNHYNSKTMSANLTRSQRGFRPWDFRDKKKPKSSGLRIMVYHHSHHWTCRYLVVNLPILR